VVNAVGRRPANGTGNSWADRVRGVQHGGSTSVPVASVNNISEVAEDTTESADTTVSVQPQQQSLITAAGKFLYCLFMLS